MANENDELILSFVEEANEVLADAENDFIAIEEAGANIDKKLVNKTFRGIHSLKGSSGFLGLKSIGTLAHEMENVLNLIRNEEIVPNSRIIDPLLKGADVLRSMVGHIESSNDVDVTEQVKQLKASITAEASPETQELLNREVDIAFPNGSLAFVMVTEMNLVSRQRQGCNIYIVEVDLFADVHNKKRTPIEFLKNSYQHGELIQSYMSTAGIGDLTSDLPDSLNFIILFASKLDQKELGKKIKIPIKQVHLIATATQTQWDGTGPCEPNQTQASAPAEPVESTNNSEPQSQPIKTDSPAPSSTKPSQSGGQVHSSLRVSVKVLDVLMNLAGELVLGRNQLLQITDTKDYRGFESVAARIDQVTSELQEAIMQTRMQPIGSVFNKFPRLIRDMSSKLGKQCDLLIEGKDVEMDKTIVEAIGDPLTHLVRNAIDHGIESPDVRTSAGKPPRGTIILKAFHQAGKVNLSISDDGAGIDAQKLKKKAVEKGLITQEQAKQMSDRQAVALIFHPGFSTAEKVTDVSGRGVGMDVVKTNVERLGGHVDVDTTLGSGSTVNIKLPLTLAIIPSLVVRSDEEKFAIPQVNISELVHIKASQVTQKIERVKDAEVLRLRGRLLPLLRLGEVLDKQAKYRDALTKELRDDNGINIADQRTGQNPPEVVADDKRSTEARRCGTAAGSMSIIVVETGKLRYGLIVDELFDSKEIVVKPLGRHMKGCTCLAGATILGDGVVALILDIAGIAAYKHLKATDEQQTQTTKNGVTGTTTETHSVLTFSNDPKEWFGIPTSFISRIERIRSDQIDTVGGEEVLQYRGMSLALLSLENYIKAAPRPKLNSLNVVVFKVSSREIGLVAPVLEDIHDIPVELDTVTFREPGIMGSTIIDNRTVRMIDLYELAKKARPDWFGQTQQVPQATQGSGESKTKSILLAEDSNFFRTQLVSFLTGDGYEVVACEDGQEAWTTLQKNPKKFNLVLTDIEMPNMNGLELAKHIKDDPEFSHLPVVALTTLASDEDIRNGKQAGVNQYLIKMDRDELLATMREYFSKMEKQGVGV